jgi:hypothetical protein
MVHGIGASHRASDEKQFKVHGKSNQWEKQPTATVKVELQDPYLAVFHSNPLKKKENPVDVLILPFQQPQVALLAAVKAPPKATILPVVPASTTSVLASSSTTLQHTSVTPSGAMSQSTSTSSAIQLTPGINPFSGQPH